ncbi:MAG: hypothetical protein ACRD41_05360 [Candidatus Acidiferrales bacterium]
MMRAGPASGLEGKLSLDFLRRSNVITEPEDEIAASRREVAP